MTPALSPPIEDAPAADQPSSDHGLALARQGRQAEAIAVFRRVLQEQPESAEAASNLGAILAQRGQLDEAIDLFRQAARLRPDLLDAHTNLGQALASRGQLDEAEACYRRALELAPRSAEVMRKLAGVLSKRDNTDEAVELLRRAVCLRPDSVELFLQLADVHVQRGEHDLAETNSRVALALQPDHADAHNNLGVAQAKQGKHADAIDSFRRALRLRPDFPETLNNLGLVLADSGRHAEAADCYRQILRNKPNATACNNLGNALRNDGKAQESLPFYHQALALDPKCDDAHNNLGIALDQLGDLQAAADAFQQAIRLRPEFVEAHFNLALTWLRGGDYARGWPEYEWRWRLKGVTQKDFPKPLWDGAPLAGTLLLYTEQGLGDTLQFVRFAALARQRVGRVVLQCPGSLLRLLRSVPGVDHLVPQNGPLPAFDAHAPLMSLPRILGTTLETVPAKVPYLSPDPELERRWAAELGAAPGFKIGIVWQGSRQYRGDRFRSLPLACFAPLASVPGVRLYALQKGFGREQLGQEGTPPVEDLGPRLDETSGAFMDTAAVLRCLDLVISIDSALAHLAGALGVPVWLVQPSAADWRWPAGRDDSPWYPTLRLFRQRHAGDWAEVFTRVKAALVERIGASAPRAAREVASEQARRGLDLARQDRHVEAIEALRLSLQHDPGSASVQSNLGVALAGLSKHAEAETCFREALRLQPDLADALNNLGLSLLHQGHYPEAIDTFRQFLQRQSTSAEGHNNLGVALTKSGQSGEAIAACTRALELRPDFPRARENRAQEWLRQGDFARGWIEYEWRWYNRGNKRPTHPQPWWDGSPVGTLLLHCEQGLGDTFQFVRYAALARQRARRVVLQCPRSLLRLLRSVPGIDQLVPPGEPLPAFDAHAPLLSLPRILGTTLHTIPAPVPYLSPDPELERQWAAELASASGFKIGITWQGNPSYTGDSLRSIPLACFAPLASVPGVRLYALQKNHGREQLGQEGTPPVEDLGPRLDETTGAFMDTAAVLRCLDLVVSIDTAVAHLAGALGVPVWVVQPSAADWRWLAGRDDSPWYPTLRLFRQRRAGDWTEVFARVAAALVERIAGLSPRDLAAEYARRGLELVSDGHHSEAVEGLRLSLQHDPSPPFVHSNLGVALAGLGRHAEAETCFREALRLQPDLGDALNNLSLALLRQGRHHEALDAGRRFLQLQPHSAQVHQRIGNLLRESGELSEAVVHLERAVHLAPGSESAHNDLGIALYDLGRLDEAVTSYERALRICPDYVRAHTNRAMAWLKQGNYAQGWLEYEWRCRVKEFQRWPFRQPLWDGRLLQGRILLIQAEQGMGDTIQFVRYAALVRALGGRVVLQSQRALVPLLSRCPHLDQVVSTDDPLPSFDTFIHLLSLPGLFLSTPEAVPAKVPYLSADPDLVAAWRDRVRDEAPFQVGISWQCNPEHDRFSRRAIPLARFEPLARLPGVRLVNLQKVDGLDQLEALDGRFPVTVLGDHIDEDAGPFMDTAAIIRNLDLVISTDMVTAHLAGALGVPVWVALPFTSDWRWVQDQEYPPWYPSMRLFRQSRPGDWTGVFERMAAELPRLTAGSGVSPTCRVEVAAGELIDKITILQIKRERITDPEKRQNVLAELAVLEESCQGQVPDSEELQQLSIELKTVNEQIWQIEDEIRCRERDQDFGPQFVELARSVYRTNDRRAELKRAINQLLGSRLVEEKDYVNYHHDEE
jgi:tetratricopeptide (TPR) repeat protein